MNQVGNAVEDYELFPRPWFGTVRGQLATQADWGWPGPTVVGLASTVGLAMDGPTSTVGPGQLWTLASTDGLASPTKMKTFWVIKYLNIYSTNK